MTLNQQKISAEKRPEFAELFREFVSSYPATPQGQRHVTLYEEARKQARQNFEAITAAADRGEVVTEQVLLKLLPHADTSGNRERGAWIHIAPAVTKNIKGWFEGSGWTKPEDWPLVAQAILRFVRRCNDDPSQLSEACKEFSQLPYTKGFQTGILTPILNALRPDDFLLVNNKPRQVVNYFANTSFSLKLMEYPAMNATLRQLIEELTDQMRLPGVPEMRNDDLFDMFCHWLVAVKKYSFGSTRYWKIAPGENAWQWKECREGGFIAIGWDDMGDVSRMSDAEFKARRDELIATHDDWTQDGVDQVWEFAHIREGDRIVANRGTTEVLGIGTVTGPYFFVPGVRHGHRLPVEWDDLTPRRVNEGGWRKTLIKIGREKFEAICNAPPGGTQLLSGSPLPVKTLDEQAGYFIEKTFELLAQLHDNPARDFYLAHKEEFKEHVEEPFQQLFRQVATQLPSPITDLMETEKKIFGRILKNDYSRGGAWDFYWGAFYPKGSKRTEDAQLSLWINHERFKFGFSIGEHGDDQRNRFLRNCQENYETLVHLLQDILSDESIVYGSHEGIMITPDGTVVGRSNLTWKDWLSHPDRGNFDASVVLPKHKVLQYSAQQLSQQIARTFERMFPLILLTTTDDPIPAIRQYLGLLEEQPEPNPEYSLIQCAEETGFDESRLARWVRAIERKKQAIIYGPPGTGKTFLAERLARHLIGGGDGFMEVVQFHPAYAYEDFVQGIRPQSRGDGRLDYPLVPGRFLEFCNRARSRQGRCGLIIDEINRANLARVFGELMYLLEYRDREIPLASGGTFRIPDNVRIIGTMNTADRSIALVDHALRRRFAFIALYPDYDVLRRYHEKTGFNVEGLIKTLQRLNQQIGDQHYEVGISFFLRQDVDEQIEDIWQMEIEPYLEEYFFDQREKVEEFRWNKIKQTIFQ